MQSAGKRISQTNSINNPWSTLTGWHFHLLSPSFFRRKRMWKCVSIRLLPFNYQCVSRGVKCRPSDPPVSLSSAVSLLYCWVEGRMSATTSETGRGEGEGEVTKGGQACGCVCICGTVWGVLLPADLVIHQTGSIHPPHPSYSPSLLLLPYPGPISMTLCQAWNLHINFSSVAP